MLKLDLSLGSKCIFASIAALVVAQALGGCASQAGDTPFEERAEDLTANGEGVLGFESPTGWAVTAGTGIVLKSSTTHSQGAASLALNPHGASVVRSAAVAIDGAILSDISVDVQIPAHPANWTGSAQLFGECPSKGLAKTSWGTKTLVGLPTGKFTTLGFKVPAASLSKLASGCQDFHVSVGLTVPTTSVATYLLDNIELGGPAKQAGCTVGTDSSGAFTASYSSQVTWTDVGTVTLDYTTTHGTPLTNDRLYLMNGIPMYEDRYTEQSNGSTTREQTFMGALQPHDLITYSDGKTMTISFDGKTTPAVAVGTDPKNIHFSDGTPLPTLTLSRGFTDAIVALEKDMSLNGKACFSGSNSSSTQVLAYSDPHNGNGGVSGSGCTGCEADCDGGEFACLAAAAAAASACTIGYPICLAAAAAGCVGAYVGCQSYCHRSGTDCCPVACGGESDVTTPIGGCCFSGDTCARRSTDDHVALCCGAGTTSCGGELCCLAGEQCATPTSGPKMVGVGLSAACCGPNNMNAAGECCTMGKCTTDADCGGSNGCRNGCCIIG
jgi:hypothetical protein